MVGYDREDLVGGHVRWREITPAAWHAADERALAELAATGSCAPFEKEYVRKDGRRVPVLVGAAVFEGRRDEGVAFVLDLTERKRAEEALHQAQMELAHVTRVMTLGELTASIAHEINQPLTAVVTNGAACLRWLQRDRPDLDEACAAVQRVVAEGQRAGEIITRIRGLLRKSPPAPTRLALAPLVDEVVRLTQPECVRQGVALHVEVAADLPAVVGDRVQVQQVLLNLVLNALEALAAGDRAPAPGVDSGAARGGGHGAGGGRGHRGGDCPGAARQIFTAFYTTKAQGLGMGLAISRSIVEQHGGRLWAVPHAGPGATVQFTLRTAPEAG